MVAASWEGLSPEQKKLTATVVVAGVLWWVISQDIDTSNMIDFGDWGTQGPLEGNNVNTGDVVIPPSEAHQFSDSLPPFEPSEMPPASEPGYREHTNQGLTTETPIHESGVQISMASPWVTGDATEYFRETYPEDMTRGELARENRALYQYLRLNYPDFFETIPRSVGPWVTGDAVEYFRDNYPEDMTRGELARENRTLYQYLRVNHPDFFETIPSGRSVGPWVTGDATEYFRETYPEGMTRGRLHREDYALYQHLHLNHPDFFETIPRSGNPWITGDAVEYFRDNYPEGMTRGQLHLENHALYQHLRLNHPDFFETIPSGRSVGPWVTGDATEYFRETYPEDMTRGQLQRENNALYQYLRANHPDFFETIPGGYSIVSTTTIPETSVEEEVVEVVEQPEVNFRDNPQQYYIENHSGVTRDELRDVDPDFYEFLEAQQRLFIVPR